MKTQDNNIKQWVQDINKMQLRDFNDYHQLSDYSSDDCLSYSISVKYNFTKFGKQSFSKINKQFHKVRTKILMATGGNNWRRHINLMPLMIIFCDVAGSKYRKQNSLNNQMNYLDNPNDAHHHGIIFIHPYHYKYWKTENKRSNIVDVLENLSFVQSVKIDPLEKDTDRENWFSYASKVHFEHMNNTQVSDETMIILDKNEYKNNKIIPPLN